MDFTLAEEEAAVDELARQVLTDGSTQDALAAVEAVGEPYDRALWATLAETGLLGLVAPADLGGAGMADGGLLALGVLLEHAGRSAAQVPLLPTLAYGALPLARFGAGTALADGWLRRVAAGGAILTGAFAEPLADPTAPATLARPAPAVGIGEDAYREGATGWVLDGSKAFVPAGTYADAALVSARAVDASGRRLGVGVFVVELTTPGVTVTAEPTLTGVPVARVDLGGVQVGADALLGPADGSVLAWTLARVTAVSCAMVAGLADASVRLAAAHTTTRHQFGHPIAEFQAVRQRVADAYVDSRAIKMTALEAIWRLANGLPAEREVAVAKAVAAEAGAQSCAAPSTSTAASASTAPTRCTAITWRRSSWNWLSARRRRSCGRWVVYWPPRTPDWRRLGTGSGLPARRCRAGGGPRARRAGDCRPGQLRPAGRPPVRPEEPRTRATDRTGACPLCLMARGARA